MVILNCCFVKLESLRCFFKEENWFGRPMYRCYVEDIELFANDTGIIDSAIGAHSAGKTNDAVDGLDFTKGIMKNSHKELKIFLRI